MLLISSVERATPGLLAALPWKDALGIAAAAGVVFGAQKLVPTYDDTFYKGLKKPKWNPPNWVFPAVWIPLKVLQSVALWHVTKHSSPQYVAVPLLIFGAHLALGNHWNVVFFIKHELKDSLKWMGIFWGSIFGCIATFCPSSKLAAGLLVPTSVWVTIAAKLNYDIVKLNTDQAGGEAAPKEATSKEVAAPKDE